MISTEHIKSSGLAGGLISLIGTLPFGVLNVLAFTIAANESIETAVLFSLGVVVSEMIIVACCLKWIKPFLLETRIFEILQYAMVGFIFFLAIQQIQQIGTMPNEKTDLLALNYPRFLLGMGLSAINPSQFPFWLVWNQLLTNKGLLETRQSRIQYIIGIGLGTFCGLLCFIIVSLLMNGKSNLFQSTAYYLSIAGIFAFTGGFILFKLLKSRFQKSSIRKSVNE